MFYSFIKRLQQICIYVAYLPNEFAAFFALKYQAFPLVTIEVAVFDLYVILIVNIKPSYIVIL